jgi:hypothetical protein
LRFALLEHVPLTCIVLAVVVSKEPKQHKSTPDHAGLSRSKKFLSSMPTASPPLPYTFTYTYTLSSASYLELSLPPLR